MLISAELRWFWKTQCPAEVMYWFHNSGSLPGGGKVRQDKYALQHENPEIGIKRRGTKPGIEVKGLIATMPARNVKPFVGDVELWCKWTFLGRSLKVEQAVVTKKRRWLRKFDTGSGKVRELPLGEDEALIGCGRLPKEGCNLELTKVSLAGDRQEWWTLGFEAFGSLDTAPKNLKLTLAAMASHNPPSLSGGKSWSYPQWLIRNIG